MKVKVRNLDSQEYTEVFRDELIRIPAGGTVEMTRSEANAFLGQLTPIEFNNSTGRPMKPKMLKIEVDPEIHAEVRHQPIQFHAPDGTGFRTQEGLTAYMSKLTDEVGGSNEKPVRRRRAASTPDTETEPS